MTNSVSAPFALDAVAGLTEGALDRFDYVDGLPRLVRHPPRHRIPLRAPVLAGGWIADPRSRPVLAVTVVLDGSRLHEAVGGGSRLDIAATHPGVPECVGFEAVVRTDDLTAGGHHLRAYGLSEDGRWYEGGYLPFWIGVTPLRELTLANGRGAIVVEAALAMTSGGALRPAGSPIGTGDFVLLTGWAYDVAAHDAMAGVAAFDDAGGCWSAPCDVERPDIRAARALRADRLGFEIAIPAGALGRGRHLLHLRCFDANGRLYADEDRVTVSIAEQAGRFPPFARLRPAAARAAARMSVAGPGRTAGEVRSVERGAVLRVDGWALDEHGSAASLVFVELAARSDVPPQRFPAYSGVRYDTPPLGIVAPPNDDAWFSAEIDTRHVPPGTYDAALAVFERRRRSYVPHALGSFTVRAAETAGSQVGRESTQID